MKSKKATSITKQGFTLKDLKTRKNPKGGANIATSSSGTRSTGNATLFGSSGTRR